MTDFRTLLTDPHSKEDRPKQALHPNQERAYEWAREALAAAGPEAYVTLYCMVEVQLHVYRKQKPKVVPEAKVEPEL
jgi:hypothetical protein